MTEPLITVPDATLALTDHLRAACPIPDVVVGRGIGPDAGAPLSLMVVVDYADRRNVAWKAADGRFNLWGADYSAVLPLAQWLEGHLRRIDLAVDAIVSARNIRGPYEVADESPQTRLYLTADLIIRTHQED